MKILPLLLHAICLLLAVHAEDGKMHCAGSAKPSALVNVSIYRTDKCDGNSGKLLINACHMPEQHKTIPVYGGLEETIDDVKHNYSCGADSTIYGIRIVHTAVREKAKMEAAKVPGLCAEGSLLWIPNMQTNEDGFVRRCHPDKLHMEVIACRTHNGTFVPLGAETEEQYSDAAGTKFFSMTVCTEDGGSIKLMRIVVMVPVVSAPLCGSERKEDETWEEGKFEYACKMDSEGKLRVNATACLHSIWGRDKRRVEIGKLVAKDHRSTVETGDWNQLICQAREDGTAELVDYVPVYKCKNGQKLGDEWWDGNVLNACEHDGMTLDGIEPVISTKACMINNVQIPIGEEADVKDGRRCQCKILDNLPRYPGHYIPAQRSTIICTIQPDFCQIESNLNRTFTEGLFLKVCKKLVFNRAETFVNETDRPAIVVETIYCYTPDHTYRIAVGEEQKLTNGSVYDCQRVNETDAKLVLLSPEEAARPRKCANGRRINEIWEHGDVDLKCTLGSDGKPTTTVEYCYYRGNKELAQIHFASPYGFPDSGMIKCVPTEDGLAKAVEFGPACLNGKQPGEDWIEDNFVKSCVLDTWSDEYPRAVTQIKACVFQNETIAVGKWKNDVYDEKLRVPVTCHCLRKDKFPNNSDTAMAAELKCDALGEAEEKTVGTASESTATSSMCLNGRKLKEEWTEGHLLKTCVMDSNMADASKAIVVVKSCFIGHETLQVGEERSVIVGHKDGEDLYATCNCIRTDGIDNVHWPVSAAKFKCGEHPTTRPDNYCRDEAHLNKEWIEGDFVKACKEWAAAREFSVRGYRMSGPMSIRCITPDGDQIVVEEEKRLVNGSVYDCVRVNTTEAELVLLSQEEAALPRKCANGKRVNEIWEQDDLDLKCALGDNGQPSVMVDACYARLGYPGAWERIPLGETIGEIDFGQTRCVQTENGLAKVEYLSPICLNGKKLDEEWREGNLLKRCEIDRFLEDASKAIVIVKACVFQDEKIPVGEERQMLIGDEAISSTCRCVRTDRDDNYYPPAKDAEFKCSESVESVVTEPPKKNRCAILDGANVTEWTDGDFVKTCEEVETFPGVMELTEVVVRCIARQSDGAYFEISVGVTGPVQEHGIVTCKRVGLTGAELVYGDPEASTEPQPESTTERHFCTHRTHIDQERIEGQFVVACKALQEGRRGEMTTVAVRCITAEGDQILVGETLPDDKGGIRKCSMKNKYEAELLYYPPEDQGCGNGRNVGDEWLDNDDIVTICNKNGKVDLVGCFIGEHGKKLIGVGSTFLANATQYSCVKTKDHAKLVKKSFSQLCEEGDLTVDAWIAEGVVRDCVRSGEVSRVYARMCVLDDERIIEVGETIEEEFETYICERHGDYDAVLAISQARVHPDYFTVPGTCKNGKKNGEEWTDDFRVRRACHLRKGRPTVVDLGCVLPDEKIIPVGSQVTVKRPASEDSMEITHTFYCEESKEGFGVNFHSNEQLVPIEHVAKQCENGRREGDEWEHMNVLRSCKHLDDKMVVVTVHCFVGNHTIKIGEVVQTSELASVECQRVGEHDAKAVLNLIRDKFTHCDGGHKLNEEWTDRDILKACRVRAGLPKTVALGCMTEDGQFMAVRTSEVKKVNLSMPGYDTIKAVHCEAVGDSDANLSVKIFREKADDDPKSPCGAKEPGDVWAKERFLKKCKVTDENLLSGVTIGCVTLKDTQMLEGETLQEEDYHITCKRDEDGKMQIHYSFTLTEES